MSKIRVYCAISLDGFIAGPNDDLSWLGDADPTQVGDPGTVSFHAFMEQTGAMLMGRRTFDVVAGFEGDWPYGSTPVFVATSRPLPEPPATVSACRGDIQQLCDQMRQVAGERNVCLDGGNVISQALEARCVDELILTVVPVLLGRGLPLYQGHQVHHFSVEHLGYLGKMTQLKLKRDG